MSFAKLGIQDKQGKYGNLLGFWAVSHCERGFTSFPTKKTEPSGDENEGVHFVGCLGSFIHLRGNRGGAEGSGEVEIPDRVLNPKECSANAKANNTGVEPAGWRPFDASESEDRSGEVKEDPEPGIVVAVLRGVVELKIHEKQEEEANDDFCDFHKRLGGLFFTFPGTRINHFNGREEKMFQ